MKHKKVKINKETNNNNAEMKQIKPKVDWNIYKLNWSDDLGIGRY